MKGLICYYSNSGNTRLACEYIARKVTAAKFEFANMAEKVKPDISGCDLIGFAASTYYGGPPLLVRDFIDALPAQNGKPAFVFNTYGLISGKTLKLMAEWVTQKGFTVIAGHTLHMPESYPPLIARGMRFDNSPNDTEMDKFNHFISGLEQSIKTMASGATIGPSTISIGLLNHLLPVSTGKKSKRDMGAIFVDEPLCTKCKKCEKSCPHDAITMNPLPVFDSGRCRNCWTCYNQCPEKAIFTLKLKGIGHYPHPGDALKAKFSI